MRIQAHKADSFPGISHFGEDSIPSLSEPPVLPTSGLTDPGGKVVDLFIVIPPTRPADSQ